MGAEICKPVTACPEPGVESNVRGLISLFMYKMPINFLINFYKKSIIFIWNPVIRTIR
jgi:hypothetical protein